MSKRISSFIAPAVASGELSAASGFVIDDLGVQIQAALGIDVDDVEASEATLVSALLDDSGSMAGVAAEAREGFNHVMDALSDSKQSEGILMMVSNFGGVVRPYSLITDIERLDTQNYQPMGGTPLYDATLVMLGAAVTKVAQFEQSGVACRSVNFIVTDGDDNLSRHVRRDVARVVGDMLRSEKHIVAGVGIASPYVQVDFLEVFRGMGLKDEWILTPGNTASEIRRVFALISKSATRASQGAASFSKTAAGGFGA